MDFDDEASENRVIKCPIHDYISVSPEVCQFIDTRQFQRLRSIKQLSACYYVWPGATHSRFEHCLGVYHLANKMVTHLQASQPELEITNREVFCVSLAGLCHDLGHGPWSHAWDGLFMPKAQPGKSWKHEQGSELMFDFMIKDPRNDIDFAEKDATFVKALIRGDVSRCPTEKSFLFDIVANERNGIDVDKFDYILRDSHMLGDKGNLSLSRLIDSARVINNQICYEIKNADQIYELCHTRFSLHKRIYSHKTTRAIELMLVDALLAAEPTWKLSSHVYDPEKFLYLTDDIMTLIERSTEKSLEKSRQIIERIRLRKLYKAVDNKTFDWAHKDLCEKYITASRIVEAAKMEFERDPSNRPASGTLDISQLTSDDVTVELCKLHYGKAEANPMNTIMFYSKRSPNVSYHPKPGDISTLVPTCFGEVLLRVYTKKPEFFGLVQAGYRHVLQDMNALHPFEKMISHHGSPASSQDYHYSGRRSTRTPPPRDIPTPPITELSGSPRTMSWDNNSFNTVPLSYDGGATKPRSKKRKLA